MLRRLGVLAVVVVLASVLGAVPVAAQDAAGASDVEVRIVARKLEGGRIEFGLQQRASNNSWGNRQLPRVRFFPTTATVGRWLASSAIDLPVGSVRIVARRLESGRVEFGLQERQADSSWGDRRLPRVRFFPPTATTGRWLASSPLTLTAARATGPYAAVDAGGGHSCALRTDGAIVCWGNNSDGQAEAPSGRYSAVASGSEHSCGLRTDGTITCWGMNVGGQVDAPAGRYSAVTAGGQFSSSRGGHSCGLRTDRTITCWGYNHVGRTDAPAGRYGAVSAGGDHSCAMRTDGTIACWGNSGSGQLDAPAGRYSAVTSGNGHSCGLRTDGTITCWGFNWGGQADAPSGRYSAITAGWHHSCALRTDGTISCWGSNWSGQTEPPAGRFSAVSAGGEHSCGLQTDGNIACWGYKHDGWTDVPAEPVADSGGGPVDSGGTSGDSGGGSGGSDDVGATDSGDGTGDSDEGEGRPQQPGDVGGGSPDPEEPPDPTPGPPLNLRLELVDGRGLRITWDAPADDGGSAVTGYTVQVFHPRWSPSVGPSNRSFEQQRRSLEFMRVLFGLRYEVTVWAQNRDGRGEPAKNEITPCPGCGQVPGAF